MGNFVSHRDGLLGRRLPALARPLLLWAGARIEPPRRERGRRMPDARRAAAAVAAMLAACHRVARRRQGVRAALRLLQARIDAAPRGGTLVVRRRHARRPDPDPRSAVGHRRTRRGHRRRRRRQRRDDRGRRRGVPRIHGAQQRPRGDGGSRGHHRHRQPPPHRRQPTSHDVYFGIHIGGGSHAVVQDNTHRARACTHGARPGHGISVWNMHDSQILAQPDLGRARRHLPVVHRSRRRRRQRRHRVALRAALDVLAERAVRGQRRHAATCSARR